MGRRSLRGFRFRPAFGGPVRNDGGKIIVIPEGLREQPAPGPTRRLGAS